MRKFRDKLLEKWEALLDKIPHKTQVAINVLMILTLPWLLYVFLGAYPLTPELGFRRAEKENLVGPSQILGVEEIRSAYADTLIVGETEQGVILYTHNNKEVYPVDPLVYWPKRGALMVCGIPAYLRQIIPPEGDPLAVIVFDDHPEAVRAEVELQLFWENPMTGYQSRYTYTLTGTRTNPGYILVSCRMHWHNDAFENDSADITVTQFCSHAWDESYRAPEGEFPAKVRLYDEKDQLIHTETVYVFPTEEKENS